MNDVRSKSETLNLEASEFGGCKRVKVVGVGGWRSAAGVVSWRVMCCVGSAANNIP